MAVGVFWANLVGGTLLFVLAAIVVAVLVERGFGPISYELRGRDDDPE